MSKIVENLTSSWWWRATAEEWAVFVFTTAQIVGTVRWADEDAFDAITGTVSISWSVLLCLNDVEESVLLEWHFAALSHHTIWAVAGIIVITTTQNSTDIDGDECNNNKSLHFHFKLFFNSQLVYMSISTAGSFKSFW